MAKNKNRFLIDEEIEENEMSDDDIDTYYKESIPKKKPKYKKFIAPAVVAVVVCVLAVVAVILINMVDRYTPNKTILTLYEYYELDEAKEQRQLADNKVEAFVVINGEMSEEKVIMVDDVWYFNKEFVDGSLNDKFYYDEYNDELIYTTPSKIFTIPFDSQVYMADNSTKKEPYIIARKIDGSIYLAVDFIKERADFIYEVRTAPYRMLLTTEYGRTEYVTIPERSNIRTGASIKEPILSVGSEGYNWKAVGAEGEWTHLVTDDCREGYIRTKELEDTYFVTTSNNYQAPIYTSVSKPYKINLVWHAIYQIEDNDKIYEYLDRTDGVNTVSPTWYQLLDSEGNYNSFASQEYVDYIHSLGMEIWPLISDFTSVDKEYGWSEYELFANTHNRRKLIMSIMNEIETYGYDGINIDFEKVPKEVGIHYVQFLRELSIECREAEVVLSIDNYVPMSHTLHYDREEQGQIADYVIVMGYDEHYSGGEEAGSVASIDFVTNGILNTLEYVSANKLINALPFYTRMWMESKDENGNTVLNSKSYGMDAAFEAIEILGLNAVWEETVAQYVAAGEVEGVTYSIWLEEEKSMEEKMRIVQTNKLAGVAGWCLGMEKPEIWNIINTYNHE